MQQQIAEQAQLGDDADAGPVLGATLAQVLAAVRERPDEDTQVLVSKLAIFRTDGADWKELPEAEALAASAQGGDWAVAVHRTCRSTDAVERFQWTSVDWFLLPANSVKAFQYYQLGPDCRQAFQFHPAEGELISGEERIESSITGGNVHKSDYYRRGIAYAAVGRLDEAEAMLRAGDDAIEIGARTGTIVRSDSPGRSPRSITASDDETVRRMLVDDLRRKGVKVDDEKSAKR
jgi:hypothetical protein